MLTRARTLIQKIAVPHNLPRANIGTVYNTSKYETVERVVSNTIPNAYPDAHTPMTIKFLDVKSGQEYIVKDALEGEMLYDVASRHNIPVVKNCNGLFTEERDNGFGAGCSSCACLIDRNYLFLTPPPEPTEEAILVHRMPDHLRKDNMRLGCCVMVTDSFDGCTVGILEPLADPAEKQNFNFISHRKAF